MVSVDDVENELEAASQRARALIEKTDARLFTIRPGTGRWSVAECLAHLTLTSESFVPILHEAIVRARATPAARPPRMDLVGRLLRWFLEPPIRKRVETSSPFVPRSIRARAEALADFTNRQHEILELLRSARGVDLGSAKVVSPFDTRVKYNLFSAFAILAAHQRRHLWQAEQTLEEVSQARAPLPGA